MEKLSVEDLTDKSVLEGFLQKKGYCASSIFSKSKPWSRVYCIIFEGNLLIYKDQYSEKPYAAIPLNHSYEVKGDCFTSVPNIIANPISNPFLFAIKSKENQTEEHVFAAETKFEMNNWIEAIQHEIAKNIKETMLQRVLRGDLNKQEENEEERPNANPLVYSDITKCRGSTRGLPRLPKIMLGDFMLAKKLSKEAMQKFDEMNLTRPEDFYWQSIWWDSEENASDYLLKLKENGLFLVRSSSKDPSNNVLVVYMNKVLKYNISKMLLHDDTVFYIDKKKPQLTIEELCLYYHKHPLCIDPNISTEIETNCVRLKYPLKLKMQ